MGHTFFRNVELSIKGILDFVFNSSHTIMGLWFKINVSML